MSNLDEGVRGREDFLMTYGWNWQFNGQQKVQKVKRKLFADESFQNLRPSITVYRN